MARFNMEVPLELMNQFTTLENKCEDMLGEMVSEGGRIVYDTAYRNMQGSFASTGSLEQGFKMTRVYKTPSDDGVNVHIGFYGYVQGSKGTKRHKKGTPIPLIAMAREYGTSMGEAKKPFLRRSFRKGAIESAMKRVESKYIPKE